MNDSAQNHDEFQSLVYKDFYGNKETFVDIPEKIAIDRVNDHVEKWLRIRSKNNKLPNHFSHDDLFYAKSAKAINRLYSHHEKEITKGIESLKKEKKKMLKPRQKM
jgi:hypothetical protein